MTEILKHISEAALADLRQSIRSNLARYNGDGFADFTDNPSWHISLKIDFDADLFSTLDLTQKKNIVEVDLINSKIVGSALRNLTPALANEELIWARLSHVEAFEYSRVRWLESAEDEDALVSAVKTHMFAPTQTAIRDDHAISRLWWNHQIARTCMPDDVDRALQLILKTADIRSNFVERLWMSSRHNIAAAILRAMEANPHITSTEDSFRTFMKILNRQGGGIVFEALNDAEADEFVADCCIRAERMRDAA